MPQPIKISQLGGIIAVFCLLGICFLEVFAFSTPTENPVTTATQTTRTPGAEPIDSTLLTGAQPTPTPLLKKWYSTQPLPAPLASAATVLVQRSNVTYLYLIGGKNQADKPVADVWSTQVNPQNGGSLDEWQRQPSLSVPLYLHAAVTISDSIYVIGGWDGENWRAEIWRARLNTDGTLQPWGHVDEVKNKEGGDKIKLASHIAVGVTGSTKKWLYVIGGENDNSEIQKAVYYAEIPTIGDTFAWKIAKPLPTRLYHMAAAVYGQTIYVTGGLNEHNQPQAKVYFATVDGAGQIHEWPDVAQNQPLYYHQAVIHQGHLVLLGGDKTSTRNSRMSIRRKL